MLIQAFLVKILGMFVHKHEPLELQMVQSSAVTRLF